MGTAAGGKNSVKAYIDALESDGSAQLDSETLTDEQKRLERVALGFRWMGGVARKDLQAEGIELKLERLQNEKLLIIRDGRIHSTIEGFLVADGLARVLA